MNRRDQLRSLLDVHDPASPLEAEHLAEMRALCDVDGDPFARDHWHPGHFTASAFLLSPDRSQVLLIFHGKLHRWLQPGGHVDPEDVSILAAAAREVAEETGITDAEAFRGGLFDVDVHVIPARKGDPEHRHFDARFLFQANSLDFAAGSDAKDARWVPLDQVREAESDASVMRAIAKIKAMVG
ncbi:MAG: NUDIX domain-containing protein [Deltaproteobacteria bacterium]|nr:MAG: NUDIX domain-containing protein [Deltaproteobacteria bacterium]